MIPNAYGCDIPMGSYVSAVISEYSLQLRLIDKENYHLTYKFWWPDDGGWQELHDFRGHWECKGVDINLDFGDTVVSGVFTQKTLSVTGETEKKTMALYFPETTNSSKLFGGRVYWPKSFLEENTN